MNMTFVHPNDFTQEHFPIIVMSDDLRGFVGWGIKFHTSGNYNHVFIIHKSGMCVSQDFGGFKQKPYKEYLTSNQMLKFWRIKNLTKEERYKILDKIDARLAWSPWKKRYDFVGTFLGQFLNIRWLQSPWAWFCSEQVRDDMLVPLDRFKGIKWGEPNPVDLEMMFRKYPEHFEVVGYWWGE